MILGKANLSEWANFRGFHRSISTDGARAGGAHEIPTY